MRVSIEGGYIVVRGRTRLLVLRGGKLLRPDKLSAASRGDLTYIPVDEACEDGKARLIDVPGIAPRVAMVELDCSTGSGARSLVDVEELAAAASSAIYDDKSAREALTEFKRLGYPMAEWARDALARLGISLRARGEWARLVTLVAKPGAALVHSAASRNPAKELRKSLTDLHALYVAVLTVDALAQMGARVGGGGIGGEALAHARLVDGSQYSVWLNPPRLLESAGTHVVALTRGLARDFNSVIARRLVALVALIGEGDEERVRALLGKKTRVVKVYPAEGEGVEYVVPRHRGEEEYRSLVARVVGTS